MLLGASQCIDCGYHNHNSTAQKGPDDYRPALFVLLILADYIFPPDSGPGPELSACHAEAIPNERFRIPYSAFRIPYFATHFIASQASSRER